MLLRTFLVALAVPLFVATGARAQEAGTTVPLYTDLGTHHYAISTRVPLAQRYFDQGLRLYYAFNHAEAIRSFGEAARLDPGCAMCHWGLALARGPNINAPMAPDAYGPAHADAQQALALQAQASPRERALIRALAVRYAPTAPADRARLDSSYAHAMAQVAREFPADAEAAALYAEALMDLSPWNYWTRGGEPRPDTPELVAQLERVIAERPEHPGACHFYIHAVEAVHPARAVPCAERLAALMPGAGHLVHMPGHIYIRVGRYLDAIRANEHAVHADESYIRDQRPAAGAYTLGYYPHNYDFLAFAAAMAGRGEQALQAARTMASLIPVESLSDPGMRHLQHHLVRPMQILVRLERWDEVLQAPAPPEHLAHARALWHYARGRALAARGDLAGAEAELARVQAAAADPALADMRLEFNTSPAILAIAAEVLAGSIASARGAHDEAIRRLGEAAGKEDELLYGEPPEWSVPVRQDLGAALLAAGRPAEAERAYREDLTRFPENGWSLTGLARALRDQGRAAEAEEAQARLRIAWPDSAVADPRHGEAHH